MSMSCTEASKFGREHGYPHYSRTAHSLCSRSSETGVQRVPALEKLFQEADPECLTKRIHSPKRIKTERFSFRVKPHEGEKIKEYIKRHHFLTTQDFLEDVVNREMYNTEWSEITGNQDDMCDCGSPKNPEDICCPRCRRKVFDVLRNAAGQLTPQQLEFCAYLTYENRIECQERNERRYL